MFYTFQNDAGVPLWTVDKILLVLAWLVFGKMEKFVLRRPSEALLSWKNTKGKTLFWTLEHRRKLDIVT